MEGISPLDPLYVLGIGCLGNREDQMNLGLRGRSISSTLDSTTNPTLNPKPRFADDLVQLREPLLRWGALMSPHIMVLGSLYACAVEYFNYTSNKSASGVSIPVKAQPELNYPFGSSLLAVCIAFGSSLLQVSGSQLLSCMRFACQAAEKKKRNFCASILGSM